MAEAAQEGDVLYVVKATDAPVDQMRPVGVRRAHAAPEAHVWRSTPMLGDASNWWHPARAAIGQVSRLQPFDLAAQDVEPCDPVLAIPGTAAELVVVLVQRPLRFREGSCCPHRVRRCDDVHEQRLRLGEVELVPPALADVVDLDRAEREPAAAETGALSTHGFILRSRCDSIRPKGAGNGAVR